MPEPQLNQYSALINQQINQTMRKAGFWAMMLGFTCALLLLIIWLGGVMKNMQIPAVWAFFCGSYSLIIYELAKRNKITGLSQYFIYLPFASLPSVALLLAELFLPAGAATYLNGPPVLLFFFTVFLSGFLFNGRLSIITGIMAGAQYFFFYLLAKPHLETIRAADELVTQDLVSPEIYFFRALMIVAAGPVVAVLSENSKSLMQKMLNEQQEKQTIDNLFGQFVSTEVKDKIISEKKDIIGERKHVIVLFSDIRSFSTYSEGKDPEQIVQQLNEYFDKMVNCIMKHGGTVDKFIGDAIMAVFGGLLGLEKPCDSAFKAALDMRKELAELNKRWQAQGLPVFQNGVGLHYGEVLEGTIGSKDRKQFTVIGDTVNTAARLESATKQLKKNIVLSETVFEQLSDELSNDCESLGNIQVKGKSEQIMIFGVAA